jgi:hypothetical protein
VKVCEKGRKFPAGYLSSSNGGGIEAALAAVRVL